MKPALTTVAILQFLNDWNDFFAPFIYLNRIELFTAAVGIRFFQYIPLETSRPARSFADGLGRDHDDSGHHLVCCGPALLHLWCRIERVKAVAASGMYKTLRRFDNRAARRF